ncbi:MAG: hypothetical protein AB2665_15250 [Candidatus Thiodiazotropha sp.]
MTNYTALTLTFVLVLPLSLPLSAEETEGSTEMQAEASEEMTNQQDAVATTGEEAQTGVAVGPAVATETAEVPATEDATAEAVDSAPTGSGSETPAAARADYATRRDHWKAREEQYQALRKRAEEAGVMLPERPPWLNQPGQSLRPGMEERMEHRQQMMSMTQEERDAYRQQRYQEMRSRAQEQGIEMPETPPWVARQQAMDDEWAKHQKVIEGMSDEERAACHAMHRRHMGMMHRGGMGQGCAMERHGCGMQQKEFNPGMAPGYAPGYGQGPGYGYGPYGYGAAPAPYDPSNFWDPNQ